MRAGEAVQVHARARLHHREGDRVAQERDRPREDFRIAPKAEPAALEGLDVPADHLEVHDRIAHLLLLSVP